MGEGIPKEIFTVQGRAENKIRVAGSNGPWFVLLFYDDQFTCSIMLIILLFYCMG